MLRLLFRRLNDIRLREKIILSFGLFMLVPLFVLGGLLILQFRESTLQEALSRAEEGVNRLERQTIDILNVGTRIMTRLSVDQSLRSLVFTHYAGTLEVFDAYHAFTAFSHYRDISPEVASIQVFADNPTLLDNGEIRPLTAAVTNEYWYRTALQHPNRNGWITVPTEIENSPLRLSLVRFLNLTTAGQKAFLVLGVDCSRLDTYLGQQGFETLVLDPQRIVVAASDNELVGRELSDPRLASLTTQALEGTYERQFEGRSSRIFSRNISLPGTYNALRIMCIVSPDVILKPADQIFVAGLALLLAGSAFAALALGIIYTLFARRLETLSRRLPLVAAGDFEQSLPVDGTDEIGQLATQINTMIRDIRALMIQVERGHDAQVKLERAQGEIRFKMLASQINPHFLFNALESIRMRAMLTGGKEIAGTVKMLGKLMRRNLEVSGTNIPLREEFENSKYYLEIVKFRLGHRLRYRFDAEPGTEELRVPPLVIEPLVENAVAHGIEGKYGEGTVTISARIVGDFLEIQVEDDGLGMSTERVQEVLSDDAGPHVGLSNIHQRLKLIYGETSGVEVDSAVGRGTRVSFRIPLDPKST